MKSDARLVCVYLQELLFYFSVLLIPFFIMFFLQYCPGGRGKLLGGIQENEGESWSAVIDTANDWVQVGAGGECNLYSETGKFTCLFVYLKKVNNMSEFRYNILIQFIQFILHIYMQQRNCQVEELLAKTTKKLHGI